MLRIVTWNVGRLYSPRGNNRLAEADVPRVARTLRELDADVVVMQELVDGAQLARILDTCREYAGALAERCVYDRHVAVLVHRRLGAVSWEQRVLEPSGRGVVAARIACAGRRVLVAGVHLDVMHEQRRSAQLAGLATLGNSWDDDVVVVAGDFNLDPTHAARRGPPSDHEGFSSLIERFTDGGRAAGPTLLGLFRIDHVLVRGHIGGHRAYVSPGRRLPLGDHDPLICDLDGL